MDELEAEVGLTSTSWHRFSRCAVGLAAVCLGASACTLTWGTGGTTSTTTTTTWAPGPGTPGGTFVTGVSGRVLVDGVGDPVYLVADAGWSLIGALDRVEIESYLDRVVARGHNGVLFNMIEAGFSSNPPFAAEPGVGAPFTGAMFTSAPSEPYWSHVDWVIAEMRERGLTAVANPVYAGFVDEHGVGAQMVAASTAQMRAFGDFIGTRYETTPNVMYQIGGDRWFDPAGPLGQRYAAVADGIVAADNSKVMTVMTGPDDYSSAMWNPPWLDVESVYENSSADLSWMDLWPVTSRPLIFGEPSYEGSRFADVAWTSLYGRRQLYVPFGFGYSGVIPGNCLRWHFGEDPLGVGCGTWGSADWPETLQDPTGTSGPGATPADQHATDTHRFAALVASLPWSTMNPDLFDTFLTAGHGSGADLASARIGNGTGFVYIPSQRQITINTTVVGPRVQLTWHDPTSNTTITIATDEPATTTRTLTHPGPNSTGHHDWVLIAQTTT